MKPSDFKRSMKKPKGSEFRNSMKKMSVKDFSENRRRPKDRKKLLKQMKKINKD